MNFFEKISPLLSRFEAENRKKSSTSEAENRKKLSTLRLSSKKGVLIKKNKCTLFFYIRTRKKKFTPRCP